MVKFTRILLICAVGGLLIAAAGEAGAQVVQKPQAKVFRPARPTFSPYFELTRPLQDSPGRLPQYYTFYQRDLQYRAMVEKQTQINKQTQNSVNSLQRSVGNLSSGVPTGVGATFNSHTGYNNTHGTYFNRNR